MKIDKPYRMSNAEYRKAQRNQKNLLQIKEALKPINKILAPIRFDRFKDYKKK